VLCALTVSNVEYADTMKMTQATRIVRGLDGTETSMPLDCIQLGYEFADADLPRLRERTQILLLDLTESRITDSGLELIASLPRLERLYLTSVVHVTDSGLRHVTKCQSLRELCILDTSVTDEGIGHLKGLKNLERLRIGSPDMSGAGIGHLMDIKTLSYLSLSITFDDENQKRVADLKTANPKLVVIPNRLDGS
jgi:hypothetical protein